MDLSKAQIETERLVLKTLSTASAPKVLAYYEANVDHFRKSMPQFADDFFTVTYHESLLKHQRKEQEQGVSLKLFLFNKEDTKCETILGDIGFSHIIRGALQSCFLGYKLQEQFLNQGYMTEALKASINFAFEEVKLHRLEANIMPFNADSIELIEKLGFEKEGFSPKYLQIDGQWENHLRYAMVNEDL